MKLKIRDTHMRFIVIAIVHCCRHGSVPLQQAATAAVSAGNARAFRVPCAVYAHSSEIVTVWPDQTQRIQKMHITLNPMPAVKIACIDSWFSANYQNLIFHVVYSTYLLKLFCHRLTVLLTCYFKFYLAIYLFKFVHFTALFHRWSLAWNLWSRR